MRRRTRRRTPESSNNHFQEERRIQAEGGCWGQGKGGEGRLFRCVWRVEKVEWKHLCGIVSPDAARKWDLTAGFNGCKRSLGGYPMTFSIRLRQKRAPERTITTGNEGLSQPRRYEKADLCCSNGRRLLLQLDRKASVNNSTDEWREGKRGGILAGEQARG